MARRKSVSSGSLDQRFKFTLMAIVAFVAVIGLVVMFGGGSLGFGEDSAGQVYKVTQTKGNVLEISSNPTGATVNVYDGRTLLFTERTPFSRLMQPGDYRLEISARGYLSEVANVVVGKRRSDSGLFIMVPSTIRTVSPIKRTQRGVSLPPPSLSTATVTTQPGDGLKVTVSPQSTAIQINLVSLSTGQQWSLSGSAAPGSVYTTIPAGDDYVYIVRGVGYESYSGGFGLTAGTQTVLDATLVAATSSTGKIRFVSTLPATVNVGGTDYPISSFHHVDVPNVVGRVNFEATAPNQQPISLSVYNLVGGDHIQIGLTFPPVVTTGSLKFTGSPLGARLQISNAQGTVLNDTVSGIQKKYALPPGQYSYTLSNVGYATQFAMFDIVAGQTTTFDISLVSTSGTLQFTGNPMGTIEISNAQGPVITATVSGSQTYTMPAGSYTYTFSWPGYVTQTGSITIVAGQTTTLSATLAAVPAWPPSGSCTSGTNECQFSEHYFCGSGSWIHIETCTYGCNTQGYCAPMPPPPPGPNGTNGTNST